jgi:hypothetical protein
MRSIVGFAPVDSGFEFFGESPFCARLASSRFRFNTKTSHYLSACPDHVPIWITSGFADDAKSGE